MCARSRSLPPAKAAASPPLFEVSARFDIFRGMWNSHTIGLGPDAQEPIEWLVLSDMAMVGGDSPWRRTHCVQPHRRGGKGMTSTAAQQASDAVSSGDVSRVVTAVFDREG